VRNGPIWHTKIRAVHNNRLEYDPKTRDQPLALRGAMNDVYGKASYVAANTLCHTKQRVPQCTKCEERCRPRSVMTAGEYI
jgi:hypothetical protein